MRQIFRTILVAVFTILAGCAPTIDIASTPTQGVLVTPSPSSSPDARATQIVLSRTREAEARLRQAQTGPVPTATKTSLPAKAPTYTPHPTWTPWWTFTPDPSPTSTPQPTLQAHTFTVRSQIVSLSIEGGYGYFIQYPPKMILYGDGLVVFHDYDKTSPIWNPMFRPLGRKLSRQEMCQLLNTIDQTGFLEYDRESYIDVFEENPTVGIRVYAWRENFAAHQRLWNWVYEGDQWYAKECRIHGQGCLTPPTILPALASAYKLLFEYHPGNLKAIPVDRMLVALPEPWTQDRTEDRIWPIQSPSLHDLLALRDPSDGYKTFVVSEPAWVDRLDRMVQTGIYSEGDLRLHVFLRPMLPYEDLNEGLSDFSARLSIPPGTTISCTPEDGLLPIPNTHDLK